MTAQGALFDTLPTPQYGDELDYYATPREALLALLPKLPVHRRDPGTKWTLIEPCAGTGAILDVLTSWVRAEYVCAVELHNGRFIELHRKYGSRENAHLFNFDFLECNLDFWDSLFGGPRLIVMNPPYTKPRETIGIEFVEKCIEVAKPDGCVSALLPLDFATGVDRCKRVHDRWKCSVYPLRRRQDFGGPHGSGQRPVAWFVWDLLEPKSEWQVIG